MSKNYKVSYLVYDKYGNVYNDDIIYFKNYKRALKYIYKKVKNLIKQSDDVDTNFDNGDELIKKLINNDEVKVVWDYKISHNYQLLGA